MKIGFIIQARVGSTRLPRKILLPFYKGKTILDVIIDELEKIKHTAVIVATSESSANDELISFVKLRNVNVYRGSENDVLNRFIGAAEKYKIDGVVRICSDNPFLDMNSMMTLVEKAYRSDVDYIGFQINNQPSIKTHFGFWGEYVSLSALKIVSSLTNEAVYHEHVTNYVYTHPDTFKIEWIKAPEILEGRNDIRLTVDTISDFRIAQKIYSDMKVMKPIFSIPDIVDYIDNHTDVLQMMRTQIKENKK